MHTIQKSKIIDKIKEPVDIISINGAVSSVPSMLDEGSFKQYNDEEGIIDEMIKISYFFSKQGKMIQAMEYLQDALSLARKTGNKKGIAATSFPASAVVTTVLDYSFIAGLGILGFSFILRLIS